jgi:hypothetical protein
MVMSWLAVIGIVLLCLVALGAVVFLGLSLWILSLRNWN